MSFYEECGNTKQLSIIAGPCVFENSAHASMMADSLKEICDRLSVNFIFKCSFDKANRTSASSYRGSGLDEAFYTFQDIKNKGIEILTDIHEGWHADSIPCDVLQIPAFLCRQTDLIREAVCTGKPVNIKKGQFLSPIEAISVIGKAEWLVESANKKPKLMITERGTTFGYHNLVVDMRTIEILSRASDYPVIIDCTHAVQAPGSEAGMSSGGDRRFAPVIARAAVGVGVAGVFMEVHDDPDNAPSDGPNMIRLEDFEGIVKMLLELDHVSKKYGRT